jgi:hypothetical protein
MQFWKTGKPVLSAVSAAVLIMVSASSDAGRAVRSDSSDTAFDILGGFWGENFEQFGAGISGRTQFRLNFGTAAGARFWTFCQSDDGIVRFVTTDTCDPAAFNLPPTGNYIAVFATDLDSSLGGSLIETRGFVDFNPPHRLPQAVPAMRFWWNGVDLVSEPDPNVRIDAQIVLLDRSQGNSPGDFDIEFNYGNGGPDSTPPAGISSDGFQGFKLGPNSRGPTTGPFGPFDTQGAPIVFCFRGGHVKPNCRQQETLTE